MRKAMEWLLVLAAAAMGLLLLAWLAQDRLVFFPQPLLSTSHLPHDAHAFEITAGDGTRLRGWIRTPRSTPAPLVLYFGGNGEEVSWALADARWPSDWAVAAINYRGYGESEGSPGETAIVADALAIYDAVAARADVDRRHVVVFGRSLGTGVAVKVAASRVVAGAILASPYDSLVAVGRGHYPWLPVSWLLKHRFDVEGAARRVHAPLLALVAESDAIVPRERSQALFDAWAGPKRWRVIGATDHNTLSTPNVFWSAVATFLTAVGRQ